MYDREELLVKVASLFYESNKTQTQISKELGISRPTIATLLAEAKEKKIVQIFISHPNKQLLKKERALQSSFPHTQIFISPQSNGSAKEAVGLTTAKLLKSLFQNNNSIGVGWGTTLSEVVKAFDFIEMNHLTFIPLIGGIVASDVQYHSNHLVSTFATKVNGKSEFLYAPALADNLEVKKSFEENSLIKNSLFRAKKVDIALVAIGNPIINSNYQEHGYLSSKEIEELNEKNVIGDILTSFFTSNGEVIQSNISDRMIGLSIPDLYQIKTVIAVSTGSEKAQSTLAALKRSFVDYLIIDETLADSLVRIVNQESESSEEEISKQ